MYLQILSDARKIYQTLDTHGLQYCLIPDACGHDVSMLHGSATLKENIPESSSNCGVWKDPVQSRMMVTITKRINTGDICTRRKNYLFARSDDTADACGIDRHDLDADSLQGSG